MILKNFKDFRVNGTKNFVDVQAIQHSEDGFSVTAYDFTSEVVEVRRKGKETSMFVLRSKHTEIPDYWKDSEVVFTTRK